MAWPESLSKFRSYVEEAQAAFGLHDWQIFVQVADDEKHLATCSCDYEAKIATIALAFKWATVPVTPGSLRRVAYHEVLHVLLAQLQILAASRSFDRNEYERAEHEVVHRVLFAVCGADVTEMKPQQEKETDE